ncbi:MAG: NPCBM/NEW2 domain-containing protein [Armatimonadota bacterium]
MDTVHRVSLFFIRALVVFAITCAFGIASLAAAPTDGAFGTPILIHFHTIFSDGQKSPQEVRHELEGAVRGVIITDHQYGASEIGSLTSEIGLPGSPPLNIKDKINASYGYPLYLKTVEALSDAKCKMIAGAEVSCHWKTEHEGHLLIADFSDPELRALCVSGEDSNNPHSGKGKTITKELKTILAVANKKGIPTIAAHPMNSEYPFPIGDPVQTPRLLEFFNTGVFDLVQQRFHQPQQEEPFLLNIYLDLLRDNHDVGVTSGSDFHSEIANGTFNKALLGSSDQWHRYTYLCGTSATPSRQEILSALFDGRTYAAVENTACLSLSPTPAFAATPAAHGTISARLRRAGNNTQQNADTVFLYRADQRLPIRQWKWPKGQDTLDISFTDNGLTPGQTYTYIIYMPYQLITSPIRIKYAPAPVQITANAFPLDHLFPVTDGNWFVKKEPFTIKGKTYQWIGYPGMPLVGGKAVFNITGCDAFEAYVGPQQNSTGNTTVTILVDGKKVWERWFDRGHAPVPVQIPLRGARQLCLMRTGNGKSGVDFLEPTIRANVTMPTYIPLDGQTPRAVGPYLFFNEHVKLQGRDYYEWAMPGVPHVGGAATFNVAGYKRFTGYSAMVEGDTCGLTFTVELDGKVVFTRHMAAGDAPCWVDLPLKNATTLTLRKKLDNILADKGVWLEPKLHR